MAQFDISAYRQNTSRPVVIRRMQAPGADTKLGNMTTWAGQTFASGVGVGTLVEETQLGSLVSVVASEAALVFL